MKKILQSQPLKRISLKERMQSQQFEFEDFKKLEIGNSQNSERLEDVILTAEKDSSIRNSEMAGQRKGLGRTPIVPKPDIPLKQRFAQNISLDLSDLRPVKMPAIKKNSLDLSDLIPEKNGLNLSNNLNLNGKASLGMIENTKPFSSGFSPNTKEALKSFYSKKNEVEVIKRKEDVVESKNNWIEDHISKNSKVAESEIESDLDMLSLEMLDEEPNPVVRNESHNTAYKSKKTAKEREREKKENIRKKKQTEFESKQKQNSKKKVAKIKNIAIHDGITVANLSVLLDSTLRQFQFQLVKAGFEEYPADYMLTAEIASMMVLEYNMNPILTSVDSADLVHRPPPADWSQYPLRPPVITIMGHVDHGKTTLLDSLRKTSVAAGEAGGITQHIGAFSVELPSRKKITFLDTPGHAAFSHMRRRGAQVTDIVVLVVAADDGVMPQTIEAIKHSIEAGVPIIVAVNKCDKPGVDASKIKQDLLRYDVVVEELGGDIPAIHVSGKTGMGLAELEDNILAIAEVSDYRGDPSGLVEAVVIESKQTSRLGYVATLIVKRGTLTPGAILVAGNSWCKVKKLVDEYGREISEVLPSNPVEVLGWKDLPNAGDHVLEAESESLAKRVVANRIRKMEIQSSLESIDDINSKRGAAREKYELMREELRRKNRKSRIREAQNEEKTVIDDTILRVLLKADVYGSVEAIEGALGALPSHEVRCEILNTGVGPVTESDLEYARATGAMIFAFNVPTSRGIQTMADELRVSISTHTIIYTLIDKAKEELSKLLKPDIVTEIVGDAIVQEVFAISSKKKITSNIAGCKVLSGTLTRQGQIRVIRNDKIIYEGKMKTFKHHKKDILEASKGLECGIAIENFDEIQQGDHIAAIVVTEKPRFI